MTKTKIVWRLTKLPTADELRELVKDKIITNEEAREILFSHEDEEERNKQSLESEIKFLRELVEKLSSGRNQIIETIKEVQIPYRKYDWYDPYKIWCGNLPDAVSNKTFAVNNAVSNFSEIKTF